MARSAPDRKRVISPLDSSALRELAFRYVARYATSSRRLADYLARKVSQRGWADEGEPPVAAVVAGCVEAGWIDDAAFAVTRAAALARAGYGARRRDLALRAIGIEREDRLAAEAALADDDPQDPALASALAYARRRRLGPFAKAASDRGTERKAVAALMRAGHSYEMARRVAGMRPDASGRDQTD